ncbi:MAG: Fmu (Sun) domain-containing protein [Flavitalea sp.]
MPRIIVSSVSMKFYSHLNSAKQLLADYTGDQPFAGYLRAYFQRNKKHGSKDRKGIGDMCYACLRLGKALQDQGVEERITIGLFLCASSKNPALEALQPQWNQFLEDNHFPAIETRISFMRNLYTGFRESEIFSFTGELSGGIDKEALTLSHLQQPDLFIRIRPGYKEKVLAALRDRQAVFEWIEPYTLRLPHSFPANSIGVIDKEIVIQDYSSQIAGGLMQSLNPKTTAGPLQVLDCCAASGGKSIMACDLLKGIQLTVTDIRQSILENLRKRFAAAGIKQYNSFVLDLSAASASALNNSSRYDLVIADVPCSGSGTWSRSPERLSFFSAGEIAKYAALQKKIVSNAITYLRPGGIILYITCSLFKKENEDIVEYIQQKEKAILLKQELIKGYHTKADSMFAALLSV